MAITNRKQTEGHTYPLKRIPADIWATIVAEATRRGVSYRVVIVDALREFVNRLGEQK